MCRTPTAPGRWGSVGMRAPSAQKGPEHEREGDEHARDREQEVTTMPHPVAEGIHAHGRTLGPGAPRTRTRRTARAHVPPVGDDDERGQCAVIDGMRMLWARAAR